MKTKKLSFKEVSGALSRDEMKNIMAGSGSCYICTCNQTGGCASCCGSSSQCFQVMYNFCGSEGGTCYISGQHGC